MATVGNSLQLQTDQTVGGSTSKPARLIPVGRKKRESIGLIYVAPEFRLGVAQPHCYIDEALLNSVSH